MSAENVEEKSRRRRVRRTVEQEVNEETDEEELDSTTSRGITAGKGRATPGRRNQLAEVEEDQGNIVTRPINGVREYFEGVRDELRKVNWPTREELRRLTVVVLVVMVISAIVLGIVNFIFTELFVIGLNAPVVFAVIFAVGIAGAFLYTRMQRRASNLTEY
ncbi:MAG: preprotein translocase subunit SecE [bacterium]|nr:preprotein translocase subunit SecE [bacterium]